MTRIVHRPRALDGGQTDLECTACTWTAPEPFIHDGHGSAATAAMDASIAAAGTHITETGHPVRAVLTTFHRDGRVEQSSMIMSPRKESA